MKIRNSAKGIIAIAALLLATTGFAAETQTITLNLKNAPIQSVLNALANESGLNISAGKDVKGNISIYLKDVSPIEALQSITKSAGLEYKIENDVIKVSPSMHKAQPDNFSGDYISRDKGLTTKVFSVNTIQPTELMALIQSFCPDVKKLSAVTTGNMIIVEASDSSIRKIERMIKQIDSAPNQVIVEAQILEIDASNNKSAGTDLRYGNLLNPMNSIQTGGFADVAAEPTASEWSDPLNPTNTAYQYTFPTNNEGFYAHLYQGKVNAFISALENKTGTNTLANPKILATSGQKATIISGSKLGYRTTGAVSGGGGVVGTNTVQFLDIGTQLSFTPYIYKDGTIKMELHPEVSDGQIGADGNPSKKTTEVTTTVVCKDGDTIIIGGLMTGSLQESNSGIPILMDIPLLGNFFKKKSSIFAKKEIIVVLTPHLVDPSKMEEMKSEAQSFQEKQGQKIEEKPGTDWWLK